jgi:uncharacterized protein DUF6677
MSALKPELTSGSGRRETPDTRGERSGAAGPCIVAWLIPGGGHFLLGITRKATIFFVVLTSMYVIGLLLGGRLFPLQMSEPLVFLSALAEWAVGVPRLTAVIGGFGVGDVVAATYEYGNTFLIVAGLLNSLVVLDAYDIAVGRKLR